MCQTVRKLYIKMYTGGLLRHTHGYLNISNGLNRMDNIKRSKQDGQYRLMVSMFQEININILFTNCQCQ
jgi:hypothetical protein